MMTREEYVHDFVQEDDMLRTVRQRIVENGMPEISVAPELGKLLTMLVRICSAKRVLEIGALGGYSGICLARGLGEDGQIVSLELKPEWADFAKRNLEEAGFGGKVTYLVGEAAHSLVELDRSGDKFDVFFIDADKPNYPLYLDYALRLANPGALVIADNVLLGDRVLNPDNMDPGPKAMKEFNAQLKTNPRFEATLLPVRDGFAIARII